jgi:prepilin-type N-terminal cleavage/methylation domain-containing protein
MNREIITLRRRLPRELPPAHSQRRAAFTLLELLISLGIILILATLTMRLLNATLNSDRIRSGSRELQSFLAGARDRALFAGQPRGVRLIPDPFDHSTCHSFVYIGAPSTFTDGSLVTITTAAGVSSIVTTPAAWTNNLVPRGLLTDGAPITLGGTQYTMSRNPPGSTTWVLTTNNYTGTTGSPIPYTLQLLPSVLPGEAPRTLPSNIVIDLDNSVLPSTWGSPGAYAGNLDVLFGPNGTVMGTVAAAGRIHFVLSEYVDASVPVPLPANSPVTGVPLMDTTNIWPAPTSNPNYGAWLANQPYTLESWVVPTPLNDLAFRCIGGGTSAGTPPPQFLTATPGQQFGDGGVTWECYNPKTRLIVSLATQTGRITTSPVSATDRYRYAEIGEVTQ